jgi:hypothetical protein
MRDSTNRWLYLFINLFLCFIFAFVFLKPFREWPFFFSKFLGLPPGHGGDDDILVRIDFVFQALENEADPSMPSDSVANQVGSNLHIFLNGVAYVFCVCCTFHVLLFAERLEHVMLNPKARLSSQV